MSFREVESYTQSSVLEQEWVVVEERKLVNFDPYIYANNPDRLDLLQEDLEKYFAECLMLSTVGVVTIDFEEGFLHSSGAAYNEVFKRAIEHYQTNPRAVERFQAEWDGFLRAQMLVEAYSKKYGILPPFMIASPPGDVYDVGAEHTKSLTYVGIPVGYDETGNPQYSLYSLPTVELDVQKHWDILESVADVQTSLQLLGETMGEITPNTVVARPAIIELLEESLRVLAIRLGFESWEAVEADTRSAMLLDSEYDRTKERRKSMIEWSIELIRRLVRDNPPRSEFEAIQETLRQVFAAERGSRYVGDEYLDKQSILMEMEQLFVGNGGDPKYTQLFTQYSHDQQNLLMGNQVRVNPELSYEESVYLLAQNARQSMMGWIGGNTLARDSYVGTGCGSGRANNLDKYNPWDVTDIFANQYDVATMTDPLANIRGIEDITSIDPGSTGKYKEYYNYEPGVCKNCHEHKTYVAHPKSPDVQCAGWCSDCEK